MGRGALAELFTLLSLLRRCVCQIDMLCIEVSKQLLDRGVGRRDIGELNRAGSFRHSQDIELRVRGAKLSLDASKSLGLGDDAGLKLVHLAGLLGERRDVQL